MGTIPYPPFQRVPTTSMLPQQLLAIIGFFLMGTMYRKRASSPKKAPTREQACQAEGDLCLFSNGLLGGAVKLPCCPTMSCVFTGKRFRCVPDLDEEQYYTNIDLENFDNNEE